MTNRSPETCPPRTPTSRARCSDPSPCRRHSCHVTVASVRVVRTHSRSSARFTLLVSNVEQTPRARLCQCSSRQNAVPVARFIRVHTREPVAGSGVRGRCSLSPVLRATTTPSGSSLTQSTTCADLLETDAASGSDEGDSCQPGRVSPVCERATSTYRTSYSASLMTQALSRSARETFQGGQRWPMHQSLQAP